MGCGCRFLGVQVVFVCGALLCFLLTAAALRRRTDAKDEPVESKGGYELVNEQKPAQEHSPVKT